MMLSENVEMQISGKFSILLVVSGGLNKDGSEILNASRQRKNTNGRLKHSQKIWTLLSRVFLMTVRLSKKGLEVSPSKYIPKMNRNEV